MGAIKSCIRIVPYEKIMGTICIAPCMKKLNLNGERPFVGSSKCEMCTCFISKDKDRQEVTCNFSEHTNSLYKKKFSIKRKLENIEKGKRKKEEAIGIM